MIINDKLYFGGWTINLKCTRDCCGDDSVQWFTTYRDSKYFYSRCDSHPASDSSGYTLFNSLDDVKAHITMEEL